MAADNRLLKGDGMRNKHKISISKLSTLFELAEKHGVNADTLLKAAGIRPDIQDSPDNMLTLDQYNTLTETAANLTHDKNFGLHQGELFKRFPNILSYTVMNCATLGDAMETYCKYQRLIDDGSFIELIIEKELAVIRFSILNDTENLSRHLYEFRLAAICSFTSHLTGITDPREMLTEVRFRHKPPADISEHRRIFQCPILFNSTINALVGKREYLSVPIKHANRELLALFEKNAEERLKRISANEPYSNKVGRILINRLQEAIPNIEEVATELSVSTRYLQLKLSKEGTSYRKILNAVRKDMAIEYLKNKQIPIAEIAWLLGFSEPSVFHRSFKKWTNCTPGMYRKHLENSR